MNTSTFMVTGYKISLVVPCRGCYFYRDDTSIDEVVEFFAHLRDVYKNDHHTAVEMDRARALVKYASCCGATLKGFHKEERDTVVISFGFDDLDNMVKFRDTMEEAVKGTAMK